MILIFIFYIHILSKIYIYKIYLYRNYYNYKIPLIQNKSNNKKKSMRESERIGELTSLGLGVGLDLQDHRGYGVSVHIVERVGQPLEPENTIHWDTS